MDSLRRYLEQEILPLYDAFDKGHGRDHALAVMARATDICRHYPQVDRAMVLAAAACHDIGLCEGRAQHHLASGRMIRADRRLLEWFSPEQLETIAQAAEDHRASAENEPRSLYGRIVAEADRLIDSDEVVRRTILYGLANYPQLDREGHWQRACAHFEEKYAEGGYLKLWIPESPNAAALDVLRRLIADKEALRRKFDTLFDLLSEQR